MEPVLRSGQPGDGAAVLALWREAGARPSSTDDLESVERLVAEHPARCSLRWSTVFSSDR
jgi:hypothetical protein